MFIFCVSLVNNNNLLDIPLFYNSYLINDILRAPLVRLRIWISALIVLARQMNLIIKNRDRLFLFMVRVLIFILIITFSIRNIIGFYIIFESSLIPTLLLVLGWGYQPERLQAGMYLILYTICASLPLLLGLLWVQRKNLHLSINISIWIIPVVDKGVRLWWFIIVMAFIVKIPLFITHLWLPKAHVEAPVAGSMVLAAILLKLGSYGLLRASSVFTWVNNSLTCFFCSIALWGACVTGAICTRQTDIKSLIAYSSVGHIGLLIAGRMSNSMWGWAGSLVLIVAHGLCSSAIFALANMTYEGTQTRRIYITKGLINIFPSITLLWFIISAANIAAPPSINLIGEVLLMTRGVYVSLYYLLPIGITAFLGAAYSLVLYTSSQHGGVPSFIKPLNLLNVRNYTIILAHGVPIILLILFSESISVWVWPCSWSNNIKLQF